MKKLNGKQVFLIIFVITIFARMYFNNIPLQRKRAEKVVNIYIELQEADTAQIESRQVKKDWLHNAYWVEIEFKDDPGKIYQYHYEKKGGVALTVFDSSGEIIENPDEVKHPWLYKGYIKPIKVS